MSLSSAALADAAATQAALSRAEDLLEPAIEDGKLAGVAPLIFVGAKPAYMETKESFPPTALAFVARLFGTENLRACEACMNPRVYASEGRLEMNSVLTVDEIKRLDEQIRGKASPARAAIWLDETPRGVSMRVVELATGKILFAGNFDGEFFEKKKTARAYNATLEIERRLRGDTLTHILFDLGLLPGPHIGIEWLEQFGTDNRNLAGLTVTAIDPVAGIGASYHRVFPEAFNVSVGAQAIASVPTVVVSAFTGDVEDLFDPPITLVGVVRIPIFDTSFAGLFTLSTNGAVSVGITLLNASFLPVIP